MPKSDTWEVGLLNLLFNNTAFGGVGDTTGLPSSGSAGNLYVSLHTATPGDGGDQTTNEVNYTGYLRVAVVRTSGGWTVAESGGTATAVNAVQITFPQCTGGSNTATYVGIGTATSGAGKLLYYGALSSSLNISNNITPAISSGQLSISED